MRIVWLLAVFLAVAVGSVEKKDRPVSRVIALLRKMQRELQEELEKDEEIFKNMDCWCRVNKKEKEAAVKEAQRRIANQEAAVNENAGRAGELEVQEKDLKNQIKEKSDALAEATALRKKESQEYQDNHKEMLKNAKALKDAISILGKHQGRSKTALQQVKSVIRHVVWRYGDLVKAEHRRTLGAFAQMPVYNSYNSQSGEIFGILENMLDNMQAELKAAQEKEDRSAKAFAELEAAQKDEIAANRESLDVAQESLSKAKVASIEAKHANGNTMEALESDRQFLSDLKSKCQQADSDWDLRKKARLEEILAVSDAIKILSDDDAHDTFDKTLNKKGVTAFVQTRSVSSVRSLLQSRLMAAAKRTGSTEVAAIAAMSALDTFEKIKEAIHKLIADRKADGAADLEQKNYCEENFQENRMARKAKQNEIEDHKAQIDQFNEDIKNLEADIQRLHDETAENVKQLKEATDIRGKENAEFKQTVADQKAAQVILRKAEERLERYYVGSGMTASEDPTEGATLNKNFLQKNKAPEPGAKVEAMPHGFSKYDKHQGGNAVIGLLKNVIQESETIVAEKTKDENDAQTAFEKFEKDTLDTNENNKKQIRSQTKAKAKATEDLVNEKSQLDTAMDVAERLQGEKADLHKECDFLLNNFDVRAAARNGEIEALQSGLSVLAGADLEES
jgi:hypothetical protein